MSRAFPVPVYTSSTVYGTSIQRTLTTTSPGSTDSTASTRGVAALGDEYYIQPETANPPAGVPLNAVGTAQGTGWFLHPVTPLVPTNDDGFTVEAGTWTIPVHTSVAGGISGNVTNATYTAILFRAKKDLSSFPQEIGRANVTIATISTTETSGTINISGAAAVFAADEGPWLEMHVSYGAQVVVGRSLRQHTNSTTATRITAAPNYTIQYARSLADSSPASDAVTRLITYNRSLADDSGVTDALARAATFPRSLDDSAPASDDLARLFTGNRALSDSPAVSDALARLFTGSRALADDASVSDDLQRTFSGNRALSDSIDPVTDLMTRLVTFNRVLADDAPASDDLARQFTGSRALADTAEVVDTLDRAAMYARTLEDALSEGGGTTVIIHPYPTVDD